MQRSYQHPFAHPFGFRFGNSGTALDEMADIHFREQAVSGIEIPSQPVRVFHTHGLQVIGVPSELQSILGQPTLVRANQIPMVPSAHFAVESGFYLLRIHNRVHMALPLTAHEARRAA